MMTMTMITRIAEVASCREVLRTLLLVVTG
jgi:hypothetical protein